MAKHKISRKIDLSDKCEDCLYQSWKKNNDMSTPYAGLGFRTLLALFSVIVLGFEVGSGNEGCLKSFFIFIIPFVREYWGFIPNTSLRKNIRNIQLCFTLVIASICILDLFSVLEVVYNLEVGIANIVISEKWAIGGGIGFPLIIVWYLTIFCFGFAFLDYFIYKPNLNISAFNNQKDINV